MSKKVKKLLKDWEIEKSYLRDYTALPVDYFVGWISAILEVLNELTEELEEVRENLENIFNEGK